MEGMLNHPHGVMEGIRLTGVEPWLQTLAPPVTHTTTRVALGSVSKLLSLISE